MGQRHSKRPKRLKSQPEVTEIIELNDNDASDSDSSEFVDELKKAVDKIESIEKRIGSLTVSQLAACRGDLKDELLTVWRTVYVLTDHNDDVRDGKVQAIGRIKEALRRLAR